MADFRLLSADPVGETTFDSDSIQVIAVDEVAEVLAASRH
jgi:hypothetical protein